MIDRSKKGENEVYKNQVIIIHLNYCAIEGIQWEYWTLKDPKSYFYPLLKLIKLFYLLCWDNRYTSTSLQAVWSESKPASCTLESFKAHSFCSQLAQSKVYQNLSSLSSKVILNIAVDIFQYFR